MSAERFPWIYRALQSRQRGESPKFNPPIHHCPQCGKDWLCSDRFTADMCGPQSEYPDSNDWTCSPCLGGDAYSDADRAAWWNAHGVDSRIESSQKS